MLFVIRHGHAGNKKQWTGDDARRPLSERGQLQAKGLVELLAPYELTRILTSPADRCRQTVEPLAGARRLDLAVDPVLGVDGDPDELVARLRDPASSGLAVCTHGEIIGAVFERLMADGLDPGPGKPKWPKGSVWVLDGLDGPAPTALLIPPAVEN
jgi:phosphohistidine phosphatase SixA